MKKFLMALFIFVLILVVIVFVIYQVHAYQEPALVTERVIDDTVYEDINGTVYALRNETVLNQAVSGVVAFSLSNGEKAAKGEVIAQIYGSEHDVYLSEEAKELQEKIETLEEYQQNQGGMTDIKSIETQIYKTLAEIARSGAEGNVASAAKKQETLELLLSQKSLLLGEVDSLQPQIDQLTLQLAEVKSSISQSIERITTPVAGYVSRGLDNLETQLPLLEEYTMTAAQFKEAISGKTTSLSGETLAAKVVSDFEIDLACLVSSEDIEDISKGQNVNLKFSFALDEMIPAKIKYISQEEGDEHLLILNCKMLLPELLTKREFSVQIIKKSYSGLRINNEALRVNEDGETGVYAAVANQAVFRKVDIIYSDKNYSIIKIDNSSSSSLLLYDEIIIRGKDLYNGKIVR